MRLSPKSLIEQVEKMNIDHQDVTVYVETEMSVNGTTTLVRQRAENFYVVGDRLVITSHEDG